MSAPRLKFRCALLAVAFSGASAALSAQTALVFPRRGGGYEIVRKVVGMRAYVEVNGKLVPAVGSRCGLDPVPEFLPVFIAVRDMHIKTSALNVIDTGQQINNELHFEATFESAYALDDVFFVLEIDAERTGKGIFYYEVGQMKSRDPRFISVVAPLAMGLGPGQAKLHLYVHGMEVFQSEQPMAFRERKLDAMVAKRIAGVREQAPKLFVGPPPEYPSSLQSAKVKGQATVEVNVDRHGAVLDPEVVSATDPAFGAAAVAAVRVWRFLPRVRDGEPVETKVQVPFNFAP